MKRIKKIALLALSATVTVAAIAFAQAQNKMEAAAPAIGVPAPAYALTDQDGKAHTLADDTGKVVLLAFYPKDFTGGCTIEAHSLTSAYPALKALGVTVYGVSVQDPKSHKSFCSKEGIPYTLLADTEKKMSAAYGVLMPGVGIANRVTYIIGTDGKVAYVDKAVNSHLMTCGDDWAAWVKAHPSQLTPAAVRSGNATTLLPSLLQVVDVTFAPGSKAPEDLTGTKPLAVGTLAPDYRLPDSTGKIHSLAADRGKPVLLEFYPADFTWSCTAEAHGLASANPAFKALGVQVYGVSVQSVQSHAAFAVKEGIGYPLLSDSGKDVTKAYGLLMPVAGGLARRVTYIIGADGRIAYADTNVNAHLGTAAQDWTAWIKANPEVKQFSPSEKPGATTATLTAYAMPTKTLRVWRNLNTVALNGGIPDKETAIGKGAFDFALPDATTGKPVSPAALSEAKKTIVLMFVSTRCPVSNAYNDRMVALAKKYAVQGVAFVGIDADQNEPKAEIASFTKEHGFPFPVLVDRGNKVSDAYNAHVTPETYVIDSKGVLVYHGRIDNDMDSENAKTHELADALDAVLAGKPVAKAQTKAFGCSIKRG